MDISKDAPAPPHFEFVGETGDRLLPVLAVVPILY